MLEVKNSTRDVYGISRTLPLNYVARKDVDEKFVENLTRNKHLIIYGSSKQGKTSLRKQCLSLSDYIVVHCSNKWNLSDLHSAILKVVGYEIVLSSSKTVAGRNKIVASLQSNEFGVIGEKEEVKSETITKNSLELDAEDVNDIIRALGKFKKFIVLEDFHYLPIETQKDFSVALKAFHEQSPISFIIVGVWLEEGRLTVYNGDLTGRIISINADKWTYQELEQVISDGEHLLNVRFSDEFKNILLRSCFESVYIVQETCFQACILSNVLSTSLQLVNIGMNIDVRNIIKDVVEQQTGRYITPVC